MIFYMEEIGLIQKQFVKLIKFWKQEEGMKSFKKWFL